VKTLLATVAIVACASPALADVPTRYVSTDHLNNIGGGSGVVIGPHEVLTNNHVVDVSMIALIDWLPCAPIQGHRT
jgi:hypothetical protein